MKDSEHLSAFLDYIREAVEREHMAKADELDALDQTQDILHQLELFDDDYPETARLGELLRKVRRERRIAKNTYEVLAPVVKWAAQQKEAIKALERALGEARKVEERQKLRFYTPKTSILEVEHESRSP